MQCASIKCYFLPLPMCIIKLPPWWALTASLPGVGPVGHRESCATPGQDGPFSVLSLVSSASSLSPFKRSLPQHWDQEQGLLCSHPALCVHPDWPQHWARGLQPFRVEWLCSRKGAGRLGSPASNQWFQAQPHTAPQWSGATPVTYPKNKSPAQTVAPAGTHLEL